jgi:hypothetical protein
MSGGLRAKKSLKSKKKSISLHHPLISESLNQWSKQLSGASRYGLEMRTTMRGMIKLMTSLTSILIRAGKLRSILMTAAKATNLLEISTLSLVISTVIRTDGTMQYGDHREILRLGLNKTSLFKEHQSDL